eukprot:Nitzschia sp. Nitz4//scaffold45_size130396//109078//111457//NITZ4_003470-RA/size130396-snap-gene-0.144-mRNA-1//-1//CDS//3329552461//9088//frame0
MLTTFENSERQFLRQKQRERHLQQMEAFTRGIEFGSDVASCTLTNPGSGQSLGDQFDFAIPRRPVRRGRHTNRKICSAILLASVGVFLLTLVLSVDFGKTNLSQEPEFYENRLAAMTSLILEWGITSPEKLQEIESPAGRALDWLVNSDTVTTDNVDIVRTRFALSTLYFATQSPDNGNEWTNNHHWLSSYSVCFWYGVECFDDGEILGVVKSLNLSANSLIGTLPSEIGLLAEDIQSLDLSANQIGGSIPQTIGLFETLEVLYLGPNEFNSTIPSHIGNLRSATGVFINDCNLKGTIPPEIGLLTKLVLSSSISFAIVEALGFHNNAITGTIPHNMLDLKELSYLYLDRNKLDGTIPKNLGMVSKLGDLQLHDNMLEGALPEELGKLQLLRAYLGQKSIFNDVLYLDGNNLSGTIPSLQLMHHLENQLTGTLSSTIGQLLSLEELRVDGNQLTGTIPASIGQLSSLVELHLQTNSFKGGIPQDLGHLSNLQQMKLHANQLTGAMPLKVCVLASFGLEQLTADCAFEEAEVACNCCTQCF